MNTSVLQVKAATATVDNNSKEVRRERNISRLLYGLGLLINSANVTHDVISFLV